MRRMIIAGIISVMFGISLFQVGCSFSLGNHSNPVYVPTYSKGGPPPWAPAYGARAKHQYYYYPDSRVYFDPGRSLYFYYSSGSWQASVSLPSGIRISAGEYVKLDMDADKPYLHQSEVEKKYPPGQLKKAGKGKNKKGD